MFFASATRRVPADTLTPTVTKIADTICSRASADYRLQQLQKPTTLLAVGYRPSLPLETDIAGRRLAPVTAATTPSQQFLTTYTLTPVEQTHCIPIAAAVTSAAGTPSTRRSPRSQQAMTARSRSRPRRCARSQQPRRAHSRRSPDAGPDHSGHDQRAHAGRPRRSPRSQPP